MDKRLFSYFSGTHLTAMVCAALLAPGAVFAGATFSNVALVHPTTGVTALVDGGGRLNTLDAVAYHRTIPETA